MPFGTPIWLELLLGFGVPIGWALWELWTLRRDRLRAQQSTRDDEPGRPSGEAPVAGDARSADRDRSGGDRAAPG